MRQVVLVPLLVHARLMMLLMLAVFRDKAAAGAWSFRWYLICKPAPPRIHALTDPAVRPAT
jgi:hypothetical protein